TLDFEPAPRGVPRVGVQFEIDANGILHVLARDLKTGNQQIVEMTSAVDVDDAAVQKMIEESVGCAFEDMQARQWIETTIQAAEILAAARKGLAEHSHELEAACKREIQSTIDRIEDALASEDPQTKVGDSS